MRPLKLFIRTNFFIRMKGRLKRLFLDFHAVSDAVSDAASDAVYGLLILSSVRPDYEDYK